MHRIFSFLFPLLIFCNFRLVHLKTVSHPDCLPGLSENEFVFGGNGYVALESRGFEPRKSSHIRFTFKTSAGEGLMYFTVTPEGHFESLEVRNGKIIYQFQLSSGRVEMAGEKRYDDGKWHNLEIRWIQEDSSLVIDDSFESVARSPGHFKSPNFKSTVYFGGFKGQHNIEGITANGFNGSVKDVQLGGTTRRLSMYTEMSNARSGCPRACLSLPRCKFDSAVAEFYASYIGSMNVELRWNTTYCSDSFVIKWHKLEAASETDETDVNKTAVFNKTDGVSKTDVFNKTVTDYLVEIDGLEPETTYTFTLHGIVNGKEIAQSKKANYSTQGQDHLSLIVTSVSNSSLSVRWEPLENFVVSLSEKSGNGPTNITTGTNFTFEDLKAGSVYMLKLVDNRRPNHFTEREVVTSPKPVYVEAQASDTDINLTWKEIADVEVRYRVKEPRNRIELCMIKRLSGGIGELSQLSYGCMYQLDVFTLSSGRRRVSNQTISVETNAKEAENFACRAGDKEGQINCTWNPKLEDACFTYQLNLSPSDRNVNRKAWENQITIDKLTPGLTYNISILSITDNGNSTTAQTTNAIAKTGIDRQFLKNCKSTTNSIKLRYFKDNEHVIDYYNVTSDETSYFLNESSKLESVENLEAGHCYRFTAYAVSQDVPSEVIEDDICTVPEPPSSAQCLYVTNNSLVLAVEMPDAGHVDHYKIEVTAVSEADRTVRSRYVNGSTSDTMIRDLRAYKYYTMKVKSALAKPHNKESTEITKICQTAEGVPGKILNLFNTTYRSDSVRLGWHKPVPENGIITFYIIRIVQPEDSKKTFSVAGDQLNHELFYPDVYAGNKYTISICAMTSVGEGQVTITTVTLKEQETNALFVALASLLAILFIILIALLLFYYIRKSPQRMMSIRRMSNRLRSPADIAMVFPQPSVTSKPIQISQFLDCVKALEKDSGLKFTEEYEDLKYVGRNQSREEAELQCNRVKNRFTNILPYDISRVKLLPMEDEDGSDYINANWIPGFNSKREFIATQGPLPSTINDFWRMVWENNCQAIIMLTLCIEKGHIKCEQYWPLDKEPVFYGDLKVEIQDENKTDEWSILEFKISLGSQSRKLKHFHYTGWPDMYVPDKKSLLAFVRMVRESVNTSSSKGPVVVHCSAGVGRTGTFIALDTLLLHIQEGHDLDVYGIVFQMRMNRVLMVQTEAQYVFIYECLNQVLEYPNGQVEETKEKPTEDDVKMENSQEEANKKESEPKTNSESKEESNKTESEPKPNSDSKEEPNKKESESKTNSDAKEEANKKESEPKPISDSKEEANKKESESKTNSDSKEEPTKKESESKPNSDSNEEPSKKELEKTVTMTQ